jgi:hypothetical protein
LGSRTDVICGAPVGLFLITYKSKVILHLGEREVGVGDFDHIVDGVDGVNELVAVAKFVEVGGLVDGADTEEFLG